MAYLFTELSDQKACSVLVVFEDDVSDGCCTLLCMC